jgi:hypothetical protein
MNECLCPVIKNSTGPREQTSLLCYIQLKVHWNIYNAKTMYTALVTVKLDLGEMCKLRFYFRHWLRLPGLGNNNEKLGLPERLSAGIQFQFRNLFHGKISGNRNFIR